MARSQWVRGERDNDVSDAEIEELLGKTLVKVTGMHKGSDEISLITTDGIVFEMWHAQDCCESVLVEDVCGNTDDLLRGPLTLASEAVDSNHDSVTDDSETWTFYTLGTVFGTVTIRWYGTSNGYYSESVDMQQYPLAVADG